MSLMSLPAADLVVPGGVLPVLRFPCGSSHVQRHHQLSDRHRHRPVRGSCLLPRCLFARVQETTYHHQAAA